MAYSSGYRIISLALAVTEVQDESLTAVSDRSTTTHRAHARLTSDTVVLHVLGVTHLTLVVLLAHDLLLGGYAGYLPAIVRYAARS
jgi:hypothetical protein